MERIERSAVVPAGREETFALVADVSSYPEFVPYCIGAKVTPVGNGVIDASLRMARGPIRFWLTTRNREHAPDRIEMRLVKGPFGLLNGHWSFEDASGGGTRVSLNLEFDGASRFLGRFAAPFLNELADSMVTAFVRRAGRATRSPRAG
ncbi:MAG: type II toxin-antitoxin system RatA family toxin [Immundisolibacterales bacterium]|nr:type II toxin-antitoxin system RatA family toxin [Immundisolibacterales bacterium]